METSTVDRILLEHIGNPASLFVFPTDIALNRWADRLLRLLGGGCLEMEKFTAWDRFKNASIRSRMQDKQSVPSVLRKIFAGRLLEENAAGVREGGEDGGIFKFLIPPAYAQGALSFTAWLSSMLPQLGSWFEKTFGRSPADAGDGAGAEFTDGEDRDLFFLTLRYRDFLEEHKLFEPAWEKPPFEDNNRECFIFFPESLRDFSEYEALLESAPRVRILRLGDMKEGDKPLRPFFYTNARSEITAAALYIRNLVEKEGLAWDEVALSIPEGEDYEPYVLREFANRDIPVVKRAGKELSAYPAGQLFTGIQDCCAQGFAFTPVSNLLLNAHLPWKNRDLIDQLIDFGIQNNCLCSWTEQGRRTDVWLDAFHSLAGSREQRALAFYGDFKSALEKIAGARSFRDTLRYYFAFRERFLDISQCRAETDAVLSRCVSELLGLVEIENSFPGLSAPDPYGFFIEHLRETSYLAQETRRGVSMLPYRTAACVPFACQVVLGASQDNLSMVFSRLNFLARRKKESLGLGDIDASEAFIAFHRFNSGLRAAFFCSRQSFGGFKIPHGGLGAPEEPAPGPPEGEDFAADLFAAEESALEDLGNPGPAIRELHGVQAGGYRAWAARRLVLNQSLESGVPGGRSLGELLKKSRGGERPRISASDLEPYFRCSVEWLYRRVLKLESRRMETTLMAENVTGTLYHAVLDRFFKSLRGEPLAGLRPDSPRELPEGYRALLEAAIREVLGGLPLLPGERVPLSSLTTRFLRAQAGALRRQLEILLRNLLGYFGGCRVAGSELNYELDKQRYCLVGKVDLLLSGGEDSEDGSLIVDFKLNYLPKRGACVGQGERGLENFQLPMYITLAEAAGAPPVQGALFFRILKTDLRVILGRVRDRLSGKEKPPARQAILRGPDRTGGDGGDNAGSGDSDTEGCDGKGEGPVDRFGAIMAEFAAKTELYAENIPRGRLAVLSAGEAQCGVCAYRRICRTLYTVEGERGLVAPVRPEAQHA
jgi:hypothetical protein